MAVSRLRHRTVVSLFFCETLARHSRTSNANQKGWFATTLRSPFRKLRLTMRTRSELTRDLSQCGPSLLHSPPSPTSDPVEGTESQWVKKRHNLRATFIVQRSRCDLPSKVFGNLQLLNAAQPFDFPMLAKKSNGSTFSLSTNTWYALLIH